MHAYIDLHEYMHLQIHIYTFMHCVCMQAYTRMACLHLHMLAWHACNMQASCHVHLHTTPTGGGVSPWVGPFCCTSYVPLQCPPHIPQGGERHRHYTLTLEGGTTGPRDTYAYMHISYADIYGEREMYDINLHI